MKRKGEQFNEIILEGASIPLLIIMYGIPAVLIILFAILITMGIRLFLRQYRGYKAAQKEKEEDTPKQSC